MAKVLVTGATGFIGNYVIEQLLAAKHEVIASASSCAKAINTAWYQNVTFIELDFNKLNENENYFKYFQSPDKLIHLAWEGLHNYKGEYHISQNLPRHYWLIQNLVQNGLNDISITGTCFEALPVPVLNTVCRKANYRSKHLQFLPMHTPRPSIC